MRGKVVWGRGTEGFCSEAASGVGFVDLHAVSGDIKRPSPVSCRVSQLLDLVLPADNEHAVIELLRGEIM